MSLKTNFELMAAYNRWINEKLYASVATLNKEEIARDRGAFFGSILGTLNHILVADTIWLQRFAEHPQGFTSLAAIRNVRKPNSLAEIRYADIAALAAARASMDQMILAFSHELTDDILGSALAYANTKGEHFHRQLGHLVQHFFNHQTHHRGQVSVLLNQIGIDIGVTDLLPCIPSM